MIWFAHAENPPCIGFRLGNAIAAPDHEECVADAFAVWRPSSLTRYINGRTASRKESFPTPSGGLTIIGGNNRWRNCHGS